MALSAVYITTAPPTIYLGDSGELAAAAYTLGIGHPPGYPAFMFLAKIFSFIPLGDIAFRMNLLASFLGVLVFLSMFFAVRLFSTAVLKNIRDKNVLNAAALLTAFIFTLSRVFWMQALNIKGSIYVLTHLTIILTFISVMKFAVKKEMKWFYMVFLLAGFLPGLHQTSSIFAVFAVAAVVYLARSDRGVRPAGAVVGAALFLLGLFTPYIYIFIRGLSNPVVNWGDINNITQVFEHIGRKKYLEAVTVPFSLNAARFKTSVSFIQYLALYNLFVIFVLSGAWVVYKKNKTLAAFIGTFLAVNFFGLLYFTANTFYPAFVYVNSAFYLINDIFTVAIGGLGLYFAVDSLKQKQGINPYFVTVLLFIIPAIQLVTNYATNDQSKKFFAYDHAVNIMRTVEPGSAVFASTDENIFPIAYLKYVKKEYTDIHVFDGDNILEHSIYPKSPDGGPGPEKIRQAEINYIKNMTGKIYFTAPEEYPELAMKTRPYGIINRLEPDGSGPLDGGKPMALYSFRDYYNGGKMDFFYRESTAGYLCRMAQFWAISGDIAGFETYRKLAEDTAPGNTNIIRNIAFIYFFDLMDYSQAIKYLEKDVLIDPYDFQSLETIIMLYGKSNPPMTDMMLKWLRYYDEYQQDPEKKVRIKSEIDRILSSGS
jgi:hypothetical protein